MKNLILLGLLLFCGLAVNAQVQNPIPVDDEDGKFRYEEVVAVEGVDRDELYNRALAWAKENFVNVESKVEETSAGKVLHFDTQMRLWEDKKGRKVLDKLVEYEYDILFKDNRYKYEVSDFRINKGFPFPVEEWLDSEQYDEEVTSRRLNQIHEEVSGHIESMKGYIADPTEEKEEEW